MFASAAYHKTGHIPEEQKRNSFLVTIHNEPRGLISTVVVDHTTHLHFTLPAFYYFSLVGYYTNCPTIYSSVAANNRLSVISLELFKRVIINQPFDDIKHIIRPGIINRYDGIQFSGVFCRRYRSNA